MLLGGVNILFGDKSKADITSVKKNQAEEKAVEG
jgi:hypothetical protein